MAQLLEAVAAIPPCQSARRRSPAGSQINPLFSPSFAPSQAHGSKKTNNRTPLNRKEMLDALTPFKADASSITMP